VPPILLSRLLQGNTVRYRSGGADGQLLQPVRTGNAIVGRLCFVLQCFPRSTLLLFLMSSQNSSCLKVSGVGYRKPSHFSARFLTVSQNPATKRIAFTIPETN
jgi:hypothetical protein